MVEAPTLEQLRKAVIDNTKKHKGEIFEKAEFFP